MAELFDLSSCNFMIGYLFNNTDLYFDSKYKLCKEDFKDEYRGSSFLRILYATGYNLALQGAKEINGVSVGEFVKNYREQMAILEDNDYMSFIDMVKELSNAEDVSVYYNRIKKMSLLSKYHYELGWDIKKFYDIDKDDASERGKLEGFTIDEIVEYYEGKQAEITKEYCGNGTNEEIQAGVGFEEVKEMFKETPYIGADFQSPYQTSLFRGWCLGQLILRSAPSGFGKSILAVADLCSVCAKEYWDEDKQEWVKNKNRQGAGLFINTEMQLMTELTPMFVAWISNVSRSNIMDGKYEDGEEERVDRAIKILQDSEIFLVDDPNFTLRSIYSTLKDYVFNKHIKYAVFDYLQDNGVIGKEMKKTHEIVARDTIILNMADNLKMWAREFNIGILTHTQLNGNEKTSDIIDESCLAGGKAVKNKVDCGCIIMYPRKKEIKETEGLYKKRGFNLHKCNLVVHNYKVRFGKYGSNIKLYQYANLGTGRIYDLFATDVFNKPINIEKITRDIDK